METMGVRGIWGLEQLERTGISSVKCGLILLAVCVPLGYVAGLPPFGLLGGASLFAALALSRATQADLERLLPFDDGIQASIQILKPTKKLLLLCFLFDLSLNWGYIAIASTSGRGVSFVEFHQQVVLARLEGFIVWYVTTPIFSLTVAILFTALVTQAKALSHAVRRVKIDVPGLDRYSHLANPLVRVLSVMLILSSPIVGSLAIGDSEPIAFVVLVVAIVSVATLTLTALYVYPLWLLKGRIYRTRRQELDRVLRALRGDDEAMAESHLRGRASGLTVSELLDYRNFIESLWDWPLAPHVQRIVFFGMLPPLTWVLAGLVENAVGAVVGLN